MKRTATVLIMMMAIVGAHGCEGGGDRYTIDQFMDFTWIGGGAFSYDESKLLITTDLTGFFNAYSIPVGGGEMTPLTTDEKYATFALSYFPASDDFLFLRDEAGKGNYHIFMKDEQGNERDITPWPGSRAAFHGWTRDQEHMVFTSNKRDGRFEDIYLMEIKSMKPKMIFLNDAGYILGHISDDMRFLALYRYLTEHDSRMFIYDRETGDLKDLSRHEGNIVFRPMEFSPDSRYLYYLTNRDSEFFYLCRYELSSGQSETVESTEWDIMYSYFSWNGRYRVSGVNAGGKTEIRLYDTATGEPLELEGMPEGEISRVMFSRSGRFMRFFVSGSTTPTDLYVYDFEKGAPSRITRSMSSEIDPDDMVAAQSIKYRSFDGEPIPAVYYKPRDVRPGDRIPAVIYVHGGPGGQTTFGYNGFFQYLANHGYAVLAPNNRGSSGYGKRFQALDDMRHGRDDMRDLVAGKRWLEKTGYVDPEKVGIVGHSYGGFLVLSAMIAEPEEFAAGVDLFGMVDWVRTLKDLPASWEHYKDAFYREMGYPDKDAEYLRSISPLYSAERISRPLMVFQGGLDTWVLKIEAEEVADKIRRSGGEVDYILFEDEAHGFQKKANRMKAQKEILGFLDMHVKDPH
ncbi:MAG TPA: alpha/beta fold hydrolase [Candidatus Krumholzibacterium sp.]|nr:alpha/beta fold hydrolase [Candidatus Krumholzibacterium sp.]